MTQIGCPSPAALAHQHRCAEEVDLVGDEDRVRAGPGSGAGGFGGVARVEYEKPDLGLLGAA